MARQSPVRTGVFHYVLGGEFKPRTDRQYPVCTLSRIALEAYKMGDEMSPPWPHVSGGREITYAYRPEWAVHLDVLTTWGLLKAGRKSLAPMLRSVLVTDVYNGYSLAVRYDPERGNVALREDDEVSVLPTASVNETNEAQAEVTGAVQVFFDESVRLLEESLARM